MTAVLGTTINDDMVIKLYHWILKGYVQTNKSEKFPGAWMMEDGKAPIRSKINLRCLHELNSKWTTE